MATSDAESDAEQHMEPCNDAYFKLIGVLGWAFIEFAGDHRR
jgi:hypothetical protein